MLSCRQTAINWPSLGHGISALVIKERPLELVIIACAFIDPGAATVIEFPIHMS